MKCTILLLIFTQTLKQSFYREITDGGARKRYLVGTESPAGHGRADELQLSAMQAGGSQSFSAPGSRAASPDAGASRPHSAGPAKGDPSVEHAHTQHPSQTGQHGAHASSGSTKNFVLSKHSTSG